MLDFQIKLHFKIMATERFLNQMIFLSVIDQKSFHSLNYKILYAPWSVIERHFF